MKKIGKLFLICTLFGVLFVTGCKNNNSNESDIKSSEGLSYNVLSNDTVEVSGIGTCQDKHIVIPKEYEGKSVTKIGNGAFEGIDFITSVVIQEGVTNIAGYAFKECKNLTKVTIPSTLTTIEDYAFFSCFRLVEVYNLSALEMNFLDPVNGYIGFYTEVIHTSLDEESIVVESGEYIFLFIEQEYYLFGYNGLETELILPNDINGNKYNLFSCALADYNSLINVTIPSSITNIAASTFLGCDSLTSVVIPKEVTTIEKQVFYSCESLTTIYYMGTSLDLSNVTMDDNNYELFAATIYFYSETQPTEAGDYWHYVNNEIVIW